MQNDEKGNTKAVGFADIKNGIEKIAESNRYANEWNIDEILAVMLSLISNKCERYDEDNENDNHCLRSSV